jgi:hypothetical protein
MLNPIERDFKQFDQLTFLLLLFILTDKVNNYTIATILGDTLQVFQFMRENSLNKKLKK